MLLHVQRLRTRLVHCDPVNAVTGLSLWVRNVLRVESLIDRLPAGASIVGAEGAGRRNRDEHSFRIGWVEQDRVQPQSTGPGRPRCPRAVATQSWKLRPVLPAVGRLEDRGIFDPGVHMVGIRQRRLEMPDALELPWMRCPVVPLMGPRHAVIRELVPDWCPCLL